MILNLDKNASSADIHLLIDKLETMGFQVSLGKDGVGTSLALVRGVDNFTRAELFSHLPLVEKVTPFPDKFKLTSKDFRQEQTVIDLGNVKIGDGSLTVFAGPCAIESETQIHEIAEAVAKSGASVLRGGAFKPRTSPYAFQGLGEQGLKYMRNAADTHGLLAVGEVMTVEDVPLVADYMDILQIGARNMQNFALLKEAGTSTTPVLLKRGWAATYTELLMAAEYILSFGNANVILCERGIRTFETHTRNTLDLAAVPVLRELTHLPILVDPSHGTGLRHLIAPMSKAALAVGADAVMIETHTDPDASVSDSRQTISIETFDRLMEDLRRIGDAMGIKINISGKQEKAA